MVKEMSLHEYIGLLQVGHKARLEYAELHSHGKKRREPIKVGEMVSADFTVISEKYLGIFEGLKIVKGRYLGMSSDGFARVLMWESNHTVEIEYSCSPRSMRRLKPTKPKIWLSHDTMKKIQALDPKSTECVQVGIWNNPPDLVGGSFYKAVRSEKTNDQK